MTEESFRKIALSMPGAVEGEHMGHPDFRAEGKIFATIFYRKDVAWGMVKLSPELRERFVGAKPEVFQPVPGAWGERGATQVCLEKAKVAEVREAVAAARGLNAPGATASRKRRNK